MNNKQKIKDFAEGLELIERIDEGITLSLDKSDYEYILNQLSNRMIIISQMNEIKRTSKVPPNLLDRLKHVWEKTNKVLVKIQEKKENIYNRLKAHKKTVAVNKKLAY